jgi:hypothetical protein
VTRAGFLPTFLLSCVRAVLLVINCPHQVIPGDRFEREREGGRGREREGGREAPGIAMLQVLLQERDDSARAAAPRPVRVTSPGPGVTVGVMIISDRMGVTVGLGAPRLIVITVLLSPSHWQ